MKKYLFLFIKRIILITAFIFFLFIIFGCRTMTLNQTAEIIPKKAVELSATTSLCASNALNYVGIPIFEFGVGALFRFGIAENIEYQLLLDNYFSLASAPYLYNSSYIENYIKIRVFKNEKINLALLPYLGFYGGEDQFGISSGLKFIGDYGKHENKKFYYGFTAGFRYNFFLNGKITNLENTQSFKYPELIVGFSLGGEYRKKRFRIRNEFFFNFNLLSSKLVTPIEPINCTMMGCTTEQVYYSIMPAFTAGYSIGIGGIIKKGIEDSNINKSEGVK